MAALFVATVGKPACAQVAVLDKGNQFFVNNGLQIWGLDSDANYPLDYSELSAGNMTGVMYAYEASNPGALSAGQKWSKWIQPLQNQSGYTSPANSLNATEAAHASDLLAIQVGDEQQSDMEDPNGYTKAWFDTAHASNLYTNQLLYTNSFFIANGANYANFIANANPDAISWDGYPFANPNGYYIQPTNWLALGNIFRRYALGNYIGATNAPTRPYGMWVQTFHDSFAVDPGEVEIRWQQFAAWTMGYKFVDAFIYRGGNNNFGGNPTGPVYQAFQETARQGRNLGPALTHLISYGYGPSIIQGQDSSGATNPVPGEWLVFNKTNAPTNQQYLMSISAANLGTKNGGHPGDVYVGFFNPLLASYGDPAGTAYFMVMNGLGGNLTLPNGQSDNTATAAECMQRITLNFDFTGSNVTSLERLRRNDGQVEIVPLTHLTGNQYQLVFDLEGGTGDLFKYNDGTPFVGIQQPAITMYWDNDANAGNNNSSTGAGLGGSGSWDAAANKWSTGSSNAIWSANNNAVFWGIGGTVTLSAPQSAGSLSFKSNGYTITGSILTLTGTGINVDSGVAATINSAIGGGVGLAKSGAGTLILGASNSYVGGTTVNAGVLQVSADSNLGADPASFAAGNITLNGGTLRFGGNFDISNNRGITLGAGGGTIDTQGFGNVAGYTQPDGIQGSGNLTKIGTGTFFMNTPSGKLNNSWTGNLVLREGTWKITERGGIPYNANNDSVYRPGQITFDGGTLQLAATISVSSNYRGITIANGGTFDTQGFNFTWGGPVIGSVASATFNKIGSGQLQLLTSTTGPGTYPGAFNINGGTVLLSGGGAWGDSSALNLANVAGVGLTISGGTETIGSLAGGGTAGGNVSLLSSLITGGNSNSTTFSGLISGSGGLTKMGAGTFTMGRAAGNTYSGTTTVSGGTLLVMNTSGSGTGTGAVSVNSGGVLGGTGALTGAVTVNSGGHIAPGASIESLDVGSLTLNAGSDLDFEFDTVLGTGVSDLLNVTANNGLTISGGTLNVVNAGTMTAGTYMLIDYSGALNGSLGNLSLGLVPNGFSYSLVNDTTNKSISLVVAVPGDFNNDGRVDAADYPVWRKGLGTTFVQSDFDVWRANFGRGPSLGSGTSPSTVPEPTNLLVLAVGAVMLELGTRASRLRARRAALVCGI